MFETAEEGGRTSKKTLGVTWLGANVAMDEMMGL